MRVGVFIDAANMYHNGGARLRYEILREFACRDGSEPIRLNAYVSHDPVKAREDDIYQHKAREFQDRLRDSGYKVILKEVRRYIDDRGNTVFKANSDLELAVDALMQSRSLDKVLLVTGDGDFVQVVRALQNMGCRVEVLGLDNVSAALRREADMFVSGYLVPDLIPLNPKGVSWGCVGSLVRGTCYHFDQEKGFGYLRYLVRIDEGVWNTASRNRGDSIYRTAFFHFSALEDDSVKRDLPSRDHIFEFRLEENQRDSENHTAKEIRLISTQ